MLATALVLLAAAALVRLLPARIAPHGAGVDQWYWKLYVETLRRTRRVPPELPQYVLERAQWYPPLFPWILSRLPASWFERHATRLSVAVDLIRMALLLWAAWAWGGGAVSLVVAGTAYALTPLLVTYNLQLNPRGLGALALDALWLSIAAIHVGAAPAAAWAVVALMGAVVLLTHKMTTQLLVFVSVVGAAIWPAPELLVVVPVSVLAAIVLSGGFYLRVTRAHADILRFWFRHWPWSGAHPVLDSPAYGQPGYESQGLFYRRGARAWLRRLAFVVGFNPWAPAALAVGALAIAEGRTPQGPEGWALGWLGLVFAFALLTTLLPVLRCLGQGYLYGYNGAFPAALFLGLSWPSLGETWYWWAGIGGAALASAIALAAFFRKLASSRTLKVDHELDAALGRLSGLPQGLVMCLPQHWHDVVAYRTRHPVLFGAHGYGFSLIEDVFPVLKCRMPELLRRHPVRYLLTLDGYLPRPFVADLPPARVESFGAYRLYVFAHPESPAGP